MDPVAPIAVYRPSPSGRAPLRPPTDGTAQMWSLSTLVPVPDRSCLPPLSLRRRRRVCSGKFGAVEYEPFGLLG